MTAEAKKRAVLLSVCGAETYRLIRNLVAPAKPTSKSFEQLVKLVHTHLNPKPAVMVELFKFHTCVRREGERVATFVVTLRQLTQYCEFGETLEDMLRDRLVCGINEACLQRRLLAKADLTFEKALTLATAWELAERNAKHLQPSIGDKDTIHALGQAKYHSEAVRRHKGECYHCGGKHNAESCNFRSTECFSCGKTGHLVRMCHRRERSRAGGGTQAHWLAEESEPQTAEDEQLGEYSLF